MTDLAMRASAHKPWMDFAQQERLKASAREAWRRFGTEAVTLRILARGDLAALEQLCWWWGWMAELQERIQLEGPTVEARAASGAVVAQMPSPLVGVLQSAEGNVARWLTHFGLTPLSRGRVRTAGGGKTEENPFAALQARMRLVRGARPNAGHAAEG